MADLSGGAGKYALGLHHADSGSFCFADNSIQAVSPAELYIKMLSHIQGIFSKIPNKFGETLTILPLEDDDVVRVEIPLRVPVRCPTRAEKRGAWDRVGVEVERYSVVRVRLLAWDDISDFEMCLIDYLPNFEGQTPE